MNASRILVFIPTYNERGNVERMARILVALDPRPDIVFLDDNSPDGTGAELDLLAAELPGIRVIHRSGKQGIGSAHQVGVAYAYDNGYDRLVTMDCDFTHDPADIPRMLAALDGYDMSVGSRYMEVGSLPGWNLMRRSLTIFGHFLTKRLLGLPHDASGAFRAYDLARIPRACFNLVTSKSYSFFFESLFVLVQNGVSIREIPIVLPARTYGHSKLTFQEAMRGGTYLMRLWIEQLAHPERFRLGRAPDVVLKGAAPAEWDDYWKSKRSAGALLYELAAAVYRRAFIRPNLERVLATTFSWGDRLLHAGCGSGQADVNLHERFQITAVDISPQALGLYGRNNPGAKRIEQADLFRLPFADNSFDGAFNLGVMEHFTPEQIRLLLLELARVVRPGGKVAFFWPHVRGTSVAVMRVAHAVLRAVARREVRLHPEEITLMAGPDMANNLLESGGFTLENYAFGPRDLFIQAVVTGRKPLAA